MEKYEIIDMYDKIVVENLIQRTTVFDLSEILTLKDVNALMDIRTYKTLRDDKDYRDVFNEATVTSLANKQFEPGNLMAYLCSDDIDYNIDIHICGPSYGLTPGKIYVTKKP